MGVLRQLMRKSSELVIYSVARMGREIWNAFWTHAQDAMERGMPLLSLGKRPVRQSPRQAEQMLSCARMRRVLTELCNGQADGRGDAIKSQMG